MWTNKKQDIRVHHMLTNKIKANMENEEKDIKGQANIDYFLFLASSILVIV